MPTVLIAATEALPTAPGRELVPETTGDAGIRLVQAIIDDTVAAARSVTDEVVVVLDPDSPLSTPEGARDVRPETDDEDERLAAGLVDLDGPVLILRNRTPQVTGPVVRDLLDSLQGPFGDAVCGLTVDEAWWAVGLARPDPAALLGIPTRGTGSGRHLLDRLHGLGLALGLADRLLAAETPDDLAAVAAEAEGGRFAAVVADLR